MGSMHRNRRGNALSIHAFGVKWSISKANHEWFWTHYKMLVAVSEIQYSLKLINSRHAMQDIEHKCHADLHMPRINLHAWIRRWQCKLLKSLRQIQIYSLKSHMFHIIRDWYSGEISCGSCRLTMYACYVVTKGPFPKTTSVTSVIVPWRVFTSDGRCTGFWTMKESCSYSAIMHE